MFLFVVLYPSRLTKTEVDRNFGIIAQLGEHLPYKQGVTGSSPVGPIFAKEFYLEAKKCECENVVETSLQDAQNTPCSHEK